MLAWCWPSSGLKEIKQGAKLGWMLAVCWLNEGANIANCKANIVCLNAGLILARFQFQTGLMIRLLSDSILNWFRLNAGLILAWCFSRGGINLLNRRPNAGFPRANMWDKRRCARRVWSWDELSLISLKGFNKMLFINRVRTEGMRKD